MNPTPALWFIFRTNNCLWRRWLLLKLKLCELIVLTIHTHNSMVSCQKGPTRNVYAWQIGPFCQDTLELLYSSVPSAVVAVYRITWIYITRYPSFWIWYDIYYPTIQLHFYVGRNHRSSVFRKICTRFCCTFLRCGHILSPSWIRDSQIFQSCFSDTGAIMSLRQC